MKNSQKPWIARTKFSGKNCLYFNFKRHYTQVFEIVPIIIYTSKSSKFATLTICRTFRINNVTIAVFESTEGTDTHHLHW